MSAGSVQHTAQIIQFPIGRYVAERKPLAATADLEREAAAIAVSDAWYHDAAIQDSMRVGER
jgi:hypothetical protein